MAGYDSATPAFVAIETPYHNDDPALLRRNICYAIQCLKHAASEHNELGYMPHLNYTQVAVGGAHTYVSDAVHDAFAVGREKVIAFTHHVREKHAEYIVLYTDFGVSRGMQSAIEVAEKCGKRVERRTLPERWMAEVRAKTEEEAVAKKRARGESGGD